jgi:hypothetical protein
MEWLCYGLGASWPATSNIGALAVAVAVVFLGVVVCGDWLAFTHSCALCAPFSRRAVLVVLCAALGRAPASIAWAWATTI